MKKSAAARGMKEREGRVPGGSEAPPPPADQARSLPFGRMEQWRLVEAKGINMPVIGGLQALRLLKSELPCTQIVMMSSSLEPAIRATALKDGATALLPEDYPSG